MPDLSHFLGDPLDPHHSLQLNNRYWPEETFQHLEILREADDDVNHLRLASLRRSLKPVKALLPLEYHRRFVSRLVYSMVSRVSFEPIKFTIKLSDAFVAANSYDGVENEFYKPAERTEELRYIVDLAHSVYRDKYGLDFVKSGFSVRYINARNTKRVNETTKYGEFSDFHLDQYSDFTCIVYLSDVGRDNGCFSYIDGTSVLFKSHLLRALHGIVTFEMNLPTPEQTASLPLELRGGMVIGNFLDDEKRAAVRDSRVDFVGKIGDGIIFNGFETLHRGGKALNGERTALFISNGGKVTLRAKRTACKLLAYLWL